MEQASFSTIAPQLEQQLADKTLAVPLLPQVAMQVLKLVNDPDSDARALMQLIESDQALAGHVMRIANSATYSPTLQMTSLQQAIARLGMNNIADIALACSLGGKTFAVPGFEPLIRLICSDSLATALWAREIARHGRRNVESTFLCGLLFQIGKPVVLQAAVDLAAAAQQSLSADCAEDLMAHYQAPVGAMLAELWQLPIAVQQTILGVDDSAPEDNDATQLASSTAAAPIVATIKAARVFAHCTERGRRYDAAMLSSEAVVIAMNLYPEDVDQLLEGADSVHQTLTALTL